MQMQAVATLNDAAPGSAFGRWSTPMNRPALSLAAVAALGLFGCPKSETPPPAAPGTTGATAPAPTPAPAPVAAAPTPPIDGGAAPDAGARRHTAAPVIPVELKEASLPEGAWRRFSLPPEGEPTVVRAAPSPRGRWLAVADSKGRVLLWDLTQPIPSPRELVGAGPEITALAFDRTEQGIAVGRADGQLQIAVVEATNPPTAFTLPAPARAISCDDQSCALSLATGALARVELANRALTLGAAKRKESAAALRIVGTTLTGIDHEGWFRVPWPELERATPVVQKLAIPKGPFVAAFTVDGLRVALADADGTASVHGSEGSLAVFGDKSVSRVPFTALDFEPEGGWLLAGRRDGSITTGPVATNGPLFELTSVHSGAVGVAAFHPTGLHMFSAGKEQSLLLWERPTDG